MTHSKFTLILILLTSTSCDSRKIVHSGFNDLLVGSQSIILYDDKTFYIEMGAGGVAGNYQIEQDIIQLKYFDKPSENWPDIMLIRENYFIAQDSLDAARYLKIKRDK